MREKFSGNLKTGLIAALVGAFAVVLAFYANGFCAATGLANDGWAITVALLLATALFCFSAIGLSVASFGEYVKSKKENGTESVVGLVLAVIGVIAGGVSAFELSVDIVLLFVF